MEKKIVCICDTYYQIIFSMQLRRTIYRDAYFAVLISNHSKNADVIAGRLSEMNFFSDVVYVESLDIEKEKNLFSVYKRIHVELSQLKGLQFDEFLFFGVGKFPVVAFDLFCKKNPKLIPSRIEEGILSYNTPFHNKRRIRDFYLSLRMLLIWQKIKSKHTIFDRLENFYCYYPDLYEGDLTPKQVPLIDSLSSISESIKELFGVAATDLSYPEKYMFFTSVYDFEGGEAIGEFKLVERIANAVGKENLIIKQHPRDRRGIYKESGYRVDERSSIPFEALLFAMDFKNKVLLTATSGACLSAGVMLKEPPQIYYLYPMCFIEQNPSALNTVSQLNKIIRSKVLRAELACVKVCTEIEEILTENCSGETEENDEDLMSNVKVGS